jgi:hypothetical protein
LKVTIALALPFIAVSKTMSSSGSDKPWPPSEGKSNRPRDRGQIIQDMPDFGIAQSTCGQMLRAGQDCFVLKYERNRQQQFKLLI